MRPNWIERSEQIFESDIDVGDGLRVVLLGPFLLVAVGIYKQLITSYGGVLVDLAMVRFDSAKIGCKLWNWWKEKRCFEKGIRFHCVKGTS